MADRKAKRVIYVAAAILLLFFGLNFYIERAMAESPDYVNAAQELPEARRTAERVFGPLTWEGYYAESGIVHHDDTVKWKKIFDSTPVAAEKYYHKTNLGTFSSRRLFVQNKAWFLGLQDRMKGLSATHNDKGTFSMKGYEHAPFTTALETGIIGAADAGDVRSMKQLANVAWEMFKVYAGEPDAFTQMDSGRLRTIIEVALLSAAIRHRHDQAVIEAVRESLAEAPPLPPLAEVYAGNLRDFLLDLDSLGRQPMSDQIKSINEEMASSHLRQSEPSKIQQWLDKVFHFHGSDNPKRVGPHAVDALKVRLLQATVTLAETGQQGAPAEWVQKTLRFAKQVDNKNDLSYEWVGGPYYGFEAVFQAQNIFRDQAAQAALSLVQRFPDLDSLPSALPADLNFADPFAAGDVIYTKTKTGFKLYSRYIDQKDGGLPPFTGIVPDEHDCRFMPGNDWNDYGLVVNYAPTDPIP